MDIMYRSCLRKVCIRNGIVFVCLAPLSVVCLRTMTLKFFLHIQKKFKTNKFAFLHPAKNVKAYKVTQIRSQILLLYVCFGFRILSLFHLCTLMIPIWNPNYLKTAKMHARTHNLLPSQIFSQAAM